MSAGGNQAELLRDQTPFDPASGARLMARQFIRNPAASMSCVVLLAIILAAILAPWLAPYDPIRIQLSSKLMPPSSEFWLGTDQFGRDVFSRLMYGTRVSLSVGLLVVAFTFVLGTPFGLLAGYIGGRIDTVIMRVVDALLTFPPLLLAVMIVGLLGGNVWNVMLAIGLVQAPVLARLVRVSAVSAREELFVTAARALGASPFRIVSVHVLRSILSPIVVQITVVFSTAIVAEASLSFLGLGVQPPQPSWGRDLAEARRFMADAPWLFLAPTSAIIVSVMALNFIGDGLRDALDPRSWTTRSRITREEARDCRY